jgi:hypothetical protein
MPARGDEDVGGLDVAMHDPRVVRRFQRVGDLDGPPQQFVRLQRLVPDALLQRLPFQQFHGDEGLPLVLADFVDHADVRMIQTRGGARFPLHPFHGLRSFGLAAGRNFSATGRDKTRSSAR